MLKEQFDADFLVNPRTSNGTFTKYSFPSKTIEYFVSGTPAIIHKLPGIPEDYYEHCITFPSSKDEDIIETFNKVLTLDPYELYHIGIDAKRFIEGEKNEKIQSAKIIELINKI